nr:pteridin transporter, putative [Leishmania guyanensis]
MRTRRTTSRRSSFELVECGKLNSGDCAEQEFEPLVTQTCLCRMFEAKKEAIFRNISIAVYGVIMTAGVVALTVLNITGTT